MNISLGEQKKKNIVKTNATVVISFFLFFFFCPKDDKEKLSPFFSRSRNQRKSRNFFFPAYIQFTNCFSYISQENIKPLFRFFFVYRYSYIFEKGKATHVNKHSPRKKSTPTNYFIIIAHIIN